MARRSGPGKVPSKHVGLSHLRVTLSDLTHIGPGRADILELIDETRSIAAAGRRMGMSYKRAWQLVHDLNEGFDAPLVETSRGGQTQGGAELTALGHEVLDAYRRMQAKAGAAIEDEIAIMQKHVKRDAGNS